MDFARRARLLSPPRFLGGVTLFFEPAVDELLEFLVEFGFPSLQFTLFGLGSIYKVVSLTLEFALE